MSTRAEQPALERHPDEIAVVPDERFARRFRRRLGLDYSQVVQRVLRETNLQPGERVLDITSEDATLALQMVSRVSPGQLISVCPIEETLQQAYRQAQAARLEERIDWRIAAIEELPFPNGTFDVVTCGLAFHLLRVPTFIREAHRLLAPGGRLVVTEALVPDSWVTKWRVRLRRSFYLYVSRNPGEAGAQFYSASELANMLQATGFSPILIRGLQKPLTQHSWVFSLIKALKQS